MSNKKKTIVTSMLQHRESALVVLLLVPIAIFSVLRPTTFFTLDNMINIMKQTSIVVIVAIAQTWILVTGGIDLSIGYSLGLAGIVMTDLFSKGINHSIAIMIGLFVSVLIGFLNGAFVTLLGIPPFIATLGMGSIARGFSYIITRGFPISLNDDFIYYLGNGYIGPIPVMTIVAFVLVIIFTFLLTKTPFGNRVMSIGGNENAAYLSGINVNKYKIIVFTLAGLLAGIAGIMLTGRLNAGNANAGLNFDTDSIAAAIVGGTSLSGGEGSVVGTVLGALILGVIRTGLVLLNVNMYWQTVVVGVIIIACLCCR